jgi:anti-sigma B factor antagonist
LKAALLELQRDGCSQFIVDLSSVEHMDSTGLGVLVGLKRQLADRGLLAIAAVPRNVLSLFEITGLDARFEIFSTLDEALIYVRGASVPASGSC